MDDLISRVAVIELIESKQRELCPVGMFGRHAVYGTDREKFDHWQEIIDEIECLPTVDVVSVVRCKDCKHRPIDRREEYNEMNGFGLEFPDSYCPCQCDDGWYNWFPGDDWYCADGERRDD